MINFYKDTNSGYSEQEFFLFHSLKSKCMFHVIMIKGPPGFHGTFTAV